jgi:hypothetical protein
VPFVAESVPDDRLSADTLWSLVGVGLLAELAGLVLAVTQWPADDTADGMAWSHVGLTAGAVGSTLLLVGIVGWCVRLALGSGVREPPRASTSRVGGR